MVRSAVLLMTLAKQRWVRETEQDHVGDFKWWGRNEGKRAAQEQETKQEKISFSDKYLCESTADQEMRNFLYESFREEVTKSKNDYDDPHDGKDGAHTWPKLDIPVTPRDFPPFGFP